VTLNCGLLPQLGTARHGQNCPALRLLLQVHIGTCEFCTIEEFRPVAESREQQVQYTVRIMSIDKYDPIRLLGEGSFGKVYLMRDKVRRNFVCVKVIKIKNIPKKEREATKLEVDLLRRLHHPNIVRYLDSFLSKNNETLCICMEYCDGGDLASQIKAARQNLFSESKILHWFVQLALGLHYMHSSKVLHRDLKTQNVFLLGNGRLVLGDLGISKVLDGTMDFAQTCIGTPYCKSYL
jgi:NIMA (never in mitosis gene a)-related kinase